jgi:phosphoribosylanthranilate isomerase
MEIKICGITNTEDALLAAELGVDALGFIFYSKSPRYCIPAAAKAIIADLEKSHPVAVGVFVNEAVAAVKATAAFCGLDMIQLHGDEPPQYCSNFSSSQLIKALTPGMAGDPALLDGYPIKAVLMDSRDADRYGGTGKTTDWDTARGIARRRALILAGGLNEHNIREAVMAVRPHAVDINSGIESAPGKGTHIAVELPLIDGARSAAEATDSDKSCTAVGGQGA